MHYCDFRRKEVINVATGKSLGYVSDFEFEEKSGCICQLIVPGPGRVCGYFCRDTSYCIDYCDVVKIGPDFILVNVCELHDKKKI